MLYIFYISRQSLHYVCTEQFDSGHFELRYWLRFILLITAYWLLVTLYFMRLIVRNDRLSHKLMIERPHLTRFIRGRVNLEGFEYYCDSVISIFTLQGLAKSQKFGINPTLK